MHFHKMGTNSIKLPSLITIENLKNIIFCYDELLFNKKLKYSLTWKNLKK